MTESPTESPSAMPVRQAPGTRRGNSFNFADLWDLVVAAVPERVAVVADISRTYLQVDERATRLAHWLQDRGVRSGDRVGVMMRNGSEFLEAYLAAYKIRAVPVNVNTRASAPELAYLAEDATLRGLVHDPDLAGVVAATDVTAAWWTLASGDSYELALAGSSPAPVEQSGRSGDDEYFIYTGGTTGYPKGVVWRMEDAFYACLGGGDPEGTRGPAARPDELTERIPAEPVVFMPAAPLMHAAGQWPALRWLFAGGTVVLVPRFDPVAVWHRISDCKVNIVNLVADAMARPLLDALDGDLARELGSLRVLASGGAPLSDPTRRQLADLLPNVVVRDIYGSSETGVQGWADWTATSTGTSSFLAFDTVLVDPETRMPLPSGEPGEGLVARRGRVPLRYHGKPDASAAVFVEHAGARLAITGDIGRLDAGGRLSVVGRGADTIITGGEKVYPREVEETLVGYPGVRDAMVIGRPHERWGQQVVALIVLPDGPGPTESDLDAHCRARLAGYKVPRRYLRVPGIVRRPNGKADYEWAHGVVDGADEPRVAHVGSRATR
jgi:acyl-CoA synthetase (AMP-forming)/AMP-acid ligase II